MWDDVAVNRYPELFDAPARMFEVLGFLEGQYLDRLVGGDITGLKQRIELQRQRASHDGRRQRSGTAEEAVSLELQDAFSEIEGREWMYALRDRAHYEVNGGCPIVLNLWQVDQLAAQLEGFQLRGVMEVYSLWQERAHGTAILLVGDRIIVLRAEKLRPSLEPLPALLVLSSVNQLLNPNPGARRKVAVGLCLVQALLAVVLYPVLCDGTRALPRRAGLAYTTVVGTVWAWSAKGSTGGDHAAVPGTAGLTMLASMVGRFWGSMKTSDRAFAAGSSVLIGSTAVRSQPGEHPVRRVLGDLGWPFAALLSARAYGRNVAEQNRLREAYVENELAAADHLGELDALEKACSVAAELLDEARRRLAAPGVDEGAAREHGGRLDVASEQLAELTLVKRQHAARHRRMTNSA